GAALDAGAFAAGGQTPPPLPPPTFPLTLTTAGTGSGGVTGAGTYAPGTMVTLGASPATGSTFSGWSQAPCASTFVMPPSALPCTATFTLIQPPPAPPTSYSLVVASTGTGSGAVTGGGTYTPGVTVTLGASPAAGSTFSGWSQAPCASTFVMPPSA